MKKTVLATVIVMAVFCFCFEVMTLAHGADKATCTAKQSGGKLNIAKDGTASCNIILADNFLLPERTAADELADYLKKVTGAEFKINKESLNKEKKSCIYVGQTKYAQQQGINFKTLESEQWIMRTADGNLVLAGGRPRGTLYAVYHFLEDVVGVHWWSPWAESVPSLATLSISILNKEGEPAFKNRCLDTVYWPWFSDVTPFTARIRINRELGYEKIPFKYGGGYNFGRHMVHAELYVHKEWSKDGTLAKHPEWVAMQKDGKRKSFADKSGIRIKNQLCLSNPEMRKAWLSKLRAEIAKTRSQPCPPMIFDASLNDIHNVCQCPSCQAIVKKYGDKDSGLLLDFVNYLADGVKDYPGVMIETLAYFTTEYTPKNIVPRKNVIITLCDTKSSCAMPIPATGYFAQRLNEWSKITKNIYVWDYHITQGAPMPFESTFQADLQFLHKKNVTGYMTDFHADRNEELWDMRLWLLAKLLEDPYQDQDKLIKTFTNGFYGPAAIYIRQYITALNKAAKEKPVHFTTAGKVEWCKYLTPSFLLKAHKIFDEAEKAVAGSKILLPRVRYARMSIDMATLALFPKIWNKWREDGKKREDLWLKRDAVGERVKNTYETEWQRRCNFEAAENYRNKYWTNNYLSKKKKFLAKIDVYLKQSELIINPPSRFSRLTVRDYTAYAADSFTCYGQPDNKSKMVEDKRTQNGISCKRELTDKNIAALKGNAFAWAMHEHGKDNSKKAVSGLKLTEIIPGRGYHWYKLDTTTISDSNFLWLYGMDVAIELSDARNTLIPTQEFEIWARIKFEGPYFKNRTNKKKNAISLEWVVAKEKK